MKFVSDLAKFFAGAVAIWSGNYSEGTVFVSDAAGDLLERWRQNERSPESFLRAAVNDYQTSAFHTSDLKEHEHDILAVHNAIAQSIDQILAADILVPAAFTEDGLEISAARELVGKFGITKANLFSEFSIEYATGMLQYCLRAAVSSDAIPRSLWGKITLEQSRRLGALEGRLAEGAYDLVPKALLERVAWRFEYNRPDASLENLDRFLAKKAQEWLEMRDRIDLLDALEGEHERRLSLVQEALSRGDVEAARGILVELEELQRQRETIPAAVRLAETRIAVAATTLFEEKITAAAEHCEIAISYVLPFSMPEARRLRDICASLLAAHYRRFGGEAIGYAIEYLSRNIEELADSDEKNDRRLLAYFLSELGHNEWLQATIGEELHETRVLLESSLEHFERAEAILLQVNDVSALAACRLSMANALRELAVVVEDSLRPAVLLRAEQAIRQSLKGFSSDPQSEEYMKVNVGLGLTLFQMANLGFGAAPAGFPPQVRRLLADAIAALESAVGDANRLGESSDEAMAHFGLGQCHYLASFDPNDDRLGRLRTAVSELTGALQFYVNENYPTLGVEARMALGHAHRSLGEATKDSDELARALDSYSSAQSVWRRRTSPVRWGTLEYELARTHFVLAKLASDPSSEAKIALERINNAVEAFVGAGINEASLVPFFILRGEILSLAEGARG